MRQVNLHEAKTDLSRLVAEAVVGEGFVVCKAGRPLVQVTRLTGADDDPANPPPAPPWSIGRSLFGARRLRPDCL